ncbi:SCND3 protein, partial [Atractosteus spatula]|nr:SCND3 protein [Atractosteus spatula]
MCGEKAAKQLDPLPPLKDTVTRRIIDIVDVKSTLIEHFKMSRCFSLRAHTVFQLLNECISENVINWKKCFGVCTDSAREITGRHSSVVARIREVAPDMKWTHCSIHREALAVKKMPEDLKSVRLCCQSCKLYQGSTNEFTSALLD